MKIQKNTLAALMLFLAGCGDAATASNPNIGCDDVPNADASAPQDVQTVEATVDANVPNAPISHHLTIRVLAPSNQPGIQDVNMIWVYPDGPNASQPFMPRFLRMAGGEYEAIETEVDVPSNEHVMNITWGFRLPSDDIAFNSLFLIQDDGSYDFTGEVIVTDELGRRWLGYPTVIKRGRYGFLRFVPDENCQRGYAQRRDGICVR